MEDSKREGIDDMLQNEMYRKVNFLCAVSEPNFWYAIGMQDNILYRVKKEGGYAEQLAYIGLPKLNIENQYMRIVLYEDRLYCLPENGFDIVVYDLKDKKIERIELPIRRQGKGYNTVKGILVGQKLYCFSCYVYYSPLVLDLSTNKIDVEQRWEPVTSLYDQKEKYFLSEIFEKDGKVYFGVSGLNKIVSFDLKNGSYTYKSIQSSKYRINRIYDCGESVWVLPCNGEKVLDISFETDKISQLPIPVQEEGYSRLVWYKEEVVLFPRNGKFMIRYNKKDASCTTLCEFPEEYHSQNQQHPFENGEMDADFLWTYPFRSNGGIRLDLKNGDMLYIDTDIDKTKSFEELVEDSLEYKDKDMRYFDERRFTLESFIKKVCDR